MARPRGFETKRDKLLKELEEASSAGTWLPLAGLAAALIWWGGAIGAVMAIFGFETISSGPPLIVSTSALLVFLPGFLMIMSGLMARQSVRAAKSNAIVLAAASRLLSPTKDISQEVDTLADDARVKVMALNDVLNDSTTAIKTIAESIDTERLKIESVSYAASDNARDLTERMSSERQAMEALTHSLKQYVGILGEAIPRQAKLMAEAASTANQDMEAADQALAARLGVMEQTSANLVSQLNGMKTIAEHAHRQTTQVQAAVDSIELKLSQSQDLVKSAEAAGQMAASSVAESGARLDKTVTEALIGARQMADEVSQRSDAARQAALDAMRELETASNAAAKAFERLKAARAEADKRTDTEPVLLNEVPKPVINQSVPNDAPALSEDNLFEAAEPVIEAPSPLPDEVEKPVLQFEKPIFPSLHSQDTNASSSGVDDELFGDRSGVFEPPASPDETPIFKPTIEPDTPEEPSAPEPSPFLSDPLNGESEKSVGWSSILADMETPLNDAEDVQKPLIVTGNSNSGADDDRADEVKALIERLTGSGIRLGEIFKAKDKKRIASASDKSEDGRRQAVRKCAGREIERLSARLRNDPDLRLSAAKFFEAEADSAIDALQASRKTNRNASPELAAFLLIDAAIGDGSSVFN